jgi:cyanophycinase
MIKTERLASSRGTLMLIGGSEDKVEQKIILRTFVECSGGRRARISILPSASQDQDSGNIYRRVFADFGARRVQIIPLFNREEADSAEVAEALAASTGVFLTGGDQSKIVATLQGTASLRAIVTAYETGAIIAGTSAGAAAVSDPMIARGGRGSLPRSGLVKIAPGLGLTRAVLIDQHFQQRHRLGRLLTAIMSFPHLLGVGVDEDTAAILTPDDQLHVIGRGVVTIVDARHAQSQSVAPAKPNGNPLALSGVVLHALVHGGQFDLGTRAVVTKEWSYEDPGDTGLSRPQHLQLDSRDSAGTRYRGFGRAALQHHPRVHRSIDRNDPDAV